jgi:regulator of sigma E protease
MVRAVVENSPAEQAGIEPGDIILEVDGQSIQSSGDLSNMVNSVEVGANISLTLLRDGQEVSKTLKPRFDDEQQQQVIGVYTGWNIVSQVDEASPSYEAGIRAEDTIYAINGQLIYNAEKMSNALESVPVDEEIDMVLLRGGNQTAVSLTNAGYQTLPGVDMRWVEGADIEQERLPVWRAVYMGARYIIYMPVLIAQAIPLMIQRPDLALVGPIGAGQLTVEVVQQSGSDTILFMGGIISLGLGIFNLFPIPPLDGGGMLVALIEGFRRGKRLSPQKVRLAQYIGTVFLITLMVLITFSDLYRLISGKGFGL